MSAAKLAPSLKHLILRRGDPPLLSPRHIQRFQTALTDFGAEAKGRGVRDEAWMVLTTAAIVALNRPSAFPPLWAHIRSLPSPSALPQSPLSNHPPQDILLLHRASLLREAALKTISFTGIAKAINNLASLSSTISTSDPDLWALLSNTISPRRGAVEIERGGKEVCRRGEELWKSVYRPLDDKLFRKLASYHPDLPQHILYNHYGPLLGDPSSSSPYPGTVGRLGTSLVAIATLRASGELGPQLVSHVFGLKKAGEEMAEGDSKVKVAEEEVGQGWRWLCEDEGCEWAVGVVDRVVEAVGVTEEPFKAKL